MSKASDQFEVDVAKNINSIPGVSAERPKVSVKYSDVRMILDDGRSSWLEVKMNHTDNLSNPRIFYDGDCWKSSYKSAAAKQAVSIMNKSKQASKFIKNISKFSGIDKPKIATTKSQLKDEQAVPLNVMKSYFSQDGVNRYIAIEEDVDLGETVTDHYINGKAEPAHYMQAGDDLYMIGGKNPLELPKAVPALSGRGPFKVRVATRSQYYEVQAEIKLKSMVASKYSLRPNSIKKNPFTFKPLGVVNRNSHMQHVEENILYGGVNGTRYTINSLRTLRNIIEGVVDGTVSIKWDGSPSIFAGNDPSDGKFFVAKKSIFNKNPKVYKSVEEIKADVDDLHLRHKLVTAFKHFYDLEIDGVIQGDLLFTKSEVALHTIDGLDYVTFHPNTIAYGYLSDSETAQEIRQAEIGVAWHTEYHGDSFSEMTAKFGVDISKLKSKPEVWMHDSKIDNVLGENLLSEDQLQTIRGHFSTAGKLFNKVSGDFLRELEADEDLPKLMAFHFNCLVRADVCIDTGEDYVEALRAFITGKFDKEIANRKSEKGKKTQADKQKRLLDLIDGNLESLANLYMLKQSVISAKKILINILDENVDAYCFVRKGDQFYKTGQEGYVFVDEETGVAQKIVDRYEFSRNNFNDDVIKGWSLNRRT